MDDENPYRSPTTAGERPPLSFNHAAVFAIRVIGAGVSLALALFFGVGGACSIWLGRFDWMQSLLWFAIVASLCVTFAGFVAPELHDHKEPQ